MKSYVIKLMPQEALNSEQRDLWSQLFLKMAAQFSFQGMEDWQIDLKKEKVLGIADEFHDLRAVKNPSSAFVFYFGQEKDARQFSEWVKKSIEGFRVSAVKLLAAKDWMKEWRKHYKPVKLAQGALWVYPAWQKVPKNRKALRIYPGQAFGTGTHATTKLCIEIFLSLPIEKNISVLDFGAGTGILAIAAQKSRKVKKALLTEIDPVALEQCKKNLRINRVNFPVKKKLNKPQKFSVVFANVLSPVLLQEANFLRDCTGEFLILSGVLAKEAKEFAQNFQKASGMFLQEIRSEGDWSALLFTTS